ncbi:restriction endonuclease subunit S [Paenibacillus alba]|uniref:Restriction endonuclease subunit S n=1 Tax=Paenibacillus alba TaxID=1197127 RepID=A0ABU6GEB4_9BACL|nr:restriction endonuclease subunit S [Paenibacillus alba]MEC0232231.1 restriction endonuclease subunit S [Paenibacillus alba]NQX69330.1 restriction endonuclease subunit S [Paenibacillus alba]
MNRNDLYLHMLDATAKLQHEIALMLEARVVEAEKSRNWICHHINSSNLEGHEHQMKQTGEIHEHVIELIDGLTKMENSLNRHMQALLGSNDAGSGDSGGSSGLGNLFSFGEDEK